MSPLEQDEVQEYYGSSGEFTSVRKLLGPGEKTTAKLLDLGRNYKTKFPIKDKDYNYRLTLEVDGKRMLLDMNGKDSIKQAIAVLYPNGPKAPLVPCFAILSRRTERKTYQGELVIERGDALSNDENLPI